MKIYVRFIVVDNIASKKRFLQVKWYQAVRTADEVWTLCEHATMLHFTTLPIVLPWYYIPEYNAAVTRYWLCLQYGLPTGKYELRLAVKKWYQFRPRVSASLVSVASRVVNSKHDELRTAVSNELYQLRPNVSALCVFVLSRVVNCTHISCIERYGYTWPTIWRSIHSFIILHTQLYAHIHNCWMISTMHSCYIMLLSIMFKSYQKKFFSGKKAGTLCS